MKTEFFSEKLHVLVYNTRVEMGNNAASIAGDEIISMLREKPELNIIFASAPSQNEFIDALVNKHGIDWNRINAFHLDEYIGLPPNAPQKFSTYLKERIFDRLPFRSVNLITPDNTSPEKECERYSSLLISNPPDIICIGIGENGHIAFNDPPVADFIDPKIAKIVDLDLKSRQQQVNDGCFGHIDEVPKHAITLTIPALFQTKRIFCMVPGSSKAKAVYNTINMPVVEDYPSTILRTHASAKLFLDADSAKLL